MRVNGGALRSAAAIAAIALGLAACSGGSGAPAGPPVAPTGPGVWSAQAGTADSGTRLSYTLPAPVEDYRVSLIEQFRVKIGGPRVTYLLVGADNTRARSDIAVNLAGDVTVRTGGTSTVVFQSAGAAIKRWITQAGPALSPDRQSQGNQLILAEQLASIALAGTVGKAVLVADGDVPTVVGISTGFTAVNGRPLVATRVSGPRAPVSNVESR